MTIGLKTEQREFLQLLISMNELSVLKLTTDDFQLIQTVLKKNRYFQSQKLYLNRLLKRWKQERPKADSNEFY